MSEDEQQFDSVDAGASHCYPMAAGSIKKNGYCMLKGKPCKVVDISTSKTGKHGHAKAHIVGLDIFTNKKYEDVCPTSHNMAVPFVKRSEFQLIDIHDNFTSLLTENGSTKDDLALPTDAEGNPDEVALQIQQMYEDGKAILVGVLAACGVEKIVSAKELV
ncbi:translation elongation factor IF5A [Cryptosporidium meleagridis]|uniref:Eukaryotic translation initiation factor 5A n=1 Tax=Cryptosporidium meleagridis TaxID=93969 RepID=A0A2P4YYB9_9CRYT|nr:translation elongation factor IF5A [Cryptosporidium meleagridis]